MWCVPDESLAYVALEGVIGEADFPMIRSFYKGVEKKETVLSIDPRVPEGFPGFSAKP